MSYLKKMLIQVQESGWTGFFLGLAGLLLGISLWLCPMEIPWEQPCQPSENPVHPSSFTWINPFSIMKRMILKTYSSSIAILVLVLVLLLVLPQQSSLMFLYGPIHFHFIRYDSNNCLQYRTKQDKKFNTFYSGLNLKP